MANVSLLIASRRKKVHEVRFLDLIITLSYYEVSWPYFREALKFLCQHEMSNILDERYSLDKCGYAPCNNILKVHPTAAVSLDIPDKKIYDISRRKKFCSDWCYAAFKFLENQLPEDPLWKNEKIKLSDFKQYPPNEKGCKGEIYFDEDDSDIIKGDIAVITDKKDDIKKHINKSIQEVEIIKNLTSTKKHIDVKTCVADENKTIDRIQNIIKSLDNIATNKKLNLDEVILKIKDKNTTHKDRKTIFLPDSQIDDKKVNFNLNEGISTLLTKVSSSLSEWFTKDTQLFLNSKEEAVHLHEIELNENDDTKFHIMPVFDSHDQVIIRRSIILRRIQSCATPILAEIGVENNTFHHRLIKFINTCKLSSHNILFSAQELKCLIIVLVEILFPTISKMVSFNKESFLKKYQINDLKRYEDTIHNIWKVLSEISIDVENEEFPKPVSSQGDF